MVQDRDGGVACQYEIAVHTVNKKGGIAVGWRGRWNGFLGGDEAVSNYSTTKNTPGVRRMPDLVCVGEYVGTDIRESREFEAVFEGRFRGVNGWGSYKCGTRHFEMVSIGFLW